MTKIQNISLLIWFYLGWFACIYFAKIDQPEWSLTFAVIPYYYYFKNRLLNLQQIVLLIGFSAIGILFDFVLFKNELIKFPNNTSSFIPIWLIAMWFLFSSVIPITQPHLRSKLWLALILGSIFGPLSYFSGETFEVLILNNQFSILIYSIFWGFYFPFILYTYGKLKVY